MQVATLFAQTAREIINFLIPYCSDYGTVLDNDNGTHLIEKIQDGEDFRHLDIDYVAFTFMAAKANVVHARSLPYSFPGDVLGEHRQVEIKDNTKLHRQITAKSLIMH